MSQALKENEAMYIDPNTGNGRIVDVEEYIIEGFKAKELMCQGSNIIRCHAGFQTELGALRKDWKEFSGKGTALNSCCRTPEHNEFVGGHHVSLHLTVNTARKTKGCMAADVRNSLYSEEELRDFKQMCWLLGWSVGHHDIFTHIDRRIEIGMTQKEFFYAGTKYKESEGSST